MRNKDKLEVLDILLDASARVFVQKQMLTQAEFYETWLESGFTLDEISEAIDTASELIDQLLDEEAERRGIERYQDPTPGKMN